MKIAATLQFVGAPLSGRPKLGATGGRPYGCMPVATDGHKSGNQSADVHPLGDTE